MPDGTFIEGFFVKGLPHGQAKLINPDGEVVEVEFDNGELVEANDSD